MLILLALTRDCEAFRAGWLGQPANTVSSLAFLVVGGWLLARARHAPARAAELRLFAAAAIATAAGSVAFHGPHPSWGQWAHDTPIAAGLMLATVVDVAAFTGRRRRELVAWLAGSAAIGLLLWFVPDAQRVVFGLLGVGFGSLELVAMRRRMRPWPGDHDFGLWVLVIASSMVGVIAFFLGRIAGFCDPRSLMQLHAVWHVLQAVAIGAYVHVAVERPAARRAAQAAG